MMRRTMVVALAFGALACGDPDTGDERSYTKAPLENPGLMVDGEDASPMASLGRPNLPVAAELEEEEPAAGGQQADGGAEVALAEGVTREQYDQGQTLFAGQAGCQACHGPDGSGSQLGPDLTDAEWLHVDAPEPAALAEVIRSGVPQPAQYPAPMPPMGGASLSAEQVDALAAYVASIGQG